MFVFSVPAVKMRAATAAAISLLVLLSVVHLHLGCCGYRDERRMDGKDDVENDTAAAKGGRKQPHIIFILIDDQVGVKCQWPDVVKAAAAI